MTKHEKKLALKRQRQANAVTDRTSAHYCWLHKVKLENIEKPTERDQKILYDIELVPWKTREKDGRLKMGRSCRSCGNTVEVSELRAILHPELEGYTEPQPNLEGLHASF